MRFRTLLLACFLALWLCGGALACPSCSDTVANNDAQTAGSLGSGFNVSIYVMLGGFFLALGLVVRTIVKGIGPAAPRQDMPPVVPVAGQLQGTAGASEPTTSKLSDNSIQ